tara:strand:+ start:16 stop:270 length:255 start_codon:yes stop_codon:yes gene_type:complete
MSEPKLVRIEWVDSTSVDEWTNLDELKADEKLLAKIITQGMLVHEDDQKYILSLNYNEKQGLNDEEVGCSIAIPKGCVTEFRLV